MADEDENNPEILLNVPSTAQLDLERRIPLLSESGGGYGNVTFTPGETHLKQDVPDGYIGVSDEYANAANDTDKPVTATEGAFAAAEDHIVGRLEDTVPSKSEDSASSTETPAVPAIDATPAGVSVDSGTNPEASTSRHGTDS